MWSWKKFPMMKSGQINVESKERVMFEPTRNNCTIDGHRAKHLFDHMDWSKKEWREKSTIMVALLGEDNAPRDPHWRVPHINGETFHRVRSKKR